MGQEFSKDGRATKIAESIPIVGYGAATVHGIAGNDEHAKRAAAKCTNSTVTTASTVAAGLVGGPPAAMAAGAAGAAAGTGIQHGISKKIDDRNVRAEVSDISVSRVATNVGFGAVGGAIGNVGSLAAGTAAKEAGYGAAKEMVAKGGASFAGSSAFVTAPKVIADKDHQDIHMAKHRARHGE